MSTAEELQRELADARAERAKARKVAHDEEYVEHVHPLLLADDAHLHVKVPGARDGLAGHVVLRPLTLQEFRRVKHVFTKSKDKPGVIEEQSKITEQLARAALVYPTKARFDELLEAHPGVAESCSDKLLARARADQESQEKG
jgi:hypothetical protein